MNTRLTGGTPHPGIKGLMRLLRKYARQRLGGHALGRIKEGAAVERCAGLEVYGPQHPNRLEITGSAIRGLSVIRPRLVA
jgi:hypothetical protein